MFSLARLGYNDWNLKYQNGTIFLFFHHSFLFDLEIWNRFGMNCRIGGNIQISGLNCNLRFQIKFFFSSSGFSCSGIGSLLDQLSSPATKKLFSYGCYSRNSLGLRLEGAGLKSGSQYRCEPTKIQSKYHIPHLNVKSAYNARYSWASIKKSSGGLFCYLTMLETCLKLNLIFLLTRCYLFPETGLFKPVIASQLKSFFIWVNNDKLSGSRFYFHFMPE